MDNKSYMHIPTLSSLTNNSNIGTKSSSISYVPTSSLNSTVLSLDSLQSNKIYPNRPVITQPTINRLLSETIKQEEFDDNSSQDTYSIHNQSKPKINQLPAPTVVTAVHLNSRETLNGFSVIPMANSNNHIITTLNPADLSDGTRSYFVPGLNDLASNYKMNPSSNTDLPSPSSSSNSSNPPTSSHHHHQHHPTRRHGEGGDPTRKREMRLQKNREAARECRRKKKEYIKCLEERVAGLEAQNKALIEELRHLKELYCQREDTNNKSNSKSTTSTR